MKDRLRKGAKMLGALWASGQKCEKGWIPACSCLEPTQFCIVKQQWVALAKQTGRVFEPDRMIVEAMLAGELFETGLTIELENGVKIGPAGIPLAEAVKFVEEPETVPAILSVLGMFPGAKMVRTA